MSYDIYNDYKFIPVDKIIRQTKKEGKDDDLEKKLNEIDENIKGSKDKDYVKEVLIDKINILEEILKELDSQIKDREFLKDTIIKKFDEGICYLRTKLFEIDAWELGRNNNIDSRRMKIEQELENLKNQRRIEARECWRDIAILKKERRQFFHEYRNALRRIKVVFPEKFKDKINLEKKVK